MSSSGVPAHAQVCSPSRTHTHIILTLTCLHINKQKQKMFYFHMSLTHWRPRAETTCPFLSSLRSKQPTLVRNNPKRSRTNNSNQTSLDPIKRCPHLMHAALSRVAGTAWRGERRGEEPTQTQETTTCSLSRCSLNSLWE